MSRTALKRSSLIRLITSNFATAANLSYLLVERASQFARSCFESKYTSRRRLASLGTRGFENLETRSLWAADLSSFRIVDDVLDITGTDSADTIEISQSQSTLTLTINSVATELPVGDVRLIKIHSGAGDDVILADRSVTIPMHVWAGAGNDIVTTGRGRDALFGEAGDDQLNGRNGNDYLRGGEGNDTLRGGTGKDTLFGDAGDDIIYGGAHSDRLRGGEGTDQLFGGAAADALNGGTGVDELTGGTGDDKIFDGRLKSTLYGPSQIDAIVFDEVGERSVAPLSEFMDSSGLPTLGALQVPGKLSGSLIDLNLGMAPRYESALIRETAEEVVLSTPPVALRSAALQYNESLTFGDVEGGISDGSEPSEQFGMMSMSSYSGGGEYGGGSGDYGDYGGGGDYGDYGDKGIWIENLDQEVVMKIDEEDQHGVDVFKVKRWGDMSEEISFRVNLGGVAIDSEFDGDYKYANGNYSFDIYLYAWESEYTITFSEVFDDLQIEGNESIVAWLNSASIYVGYENNTPPSSDPDNEAAYAYAEITDNDYPIVDIDTDSDNTGAMDLTEEEDDVEMDHPGNIVFVNNDDDNNNDSDDYLDSPFMDANGVYPMDDDDLEVFQIGLDFGNSPTVSQSYDVKLVYTNPSIFKVWTDRSKTEQIANNTVITVSAGNTKTYYFEALAEGEAVIKAYLMSGYNAVGILDSILFQATDGPYVDLTIWNSESGDDGPLTHVRDGELEREERDNSGYEQYRIKKVSNPTPQNPAATRDVRVGGAFAIANLNDTNGNGVTDKDENFVKASTAIIPNSVLLNNLNTQITVTVADVNGYKIGDLIICNIWNPTLQLKVENIIPATKQIVLGNNGNPLPAMPAIVNPFQSISHRGEGEKDLMKIRIEPPKVNVGRLDLTVESGAVKLWKSKTKDNQPVQMNGNTFSINAADIPAQGLELYVEATAASTVIGDIVLRLKYFDAANVQGNSDFVTATAIWGKGTSSLHDANQNNTVANNNDILPEHKNNILSPDKFGGLGLASPVKSTEVLVDATAFNNGILNTFNFSPSDLSFQNNVYFDGTRSVKAIIYSIDNNNKINQEPKYQREWPDIADKPNDEVFIERNGQVIDDTDDNRGVTVNNNLYLFDSPGTRVIINDPIKSVSYQGNFSDWVMAAFSSKPNSNPFTKANRELYKSRATDNLLWSVRHTIVLDTNYDPNKAISYENPVNQKYIRDTGNQNESSSNFVTTGHYQLTPPPTN